VEGVKPGPDDGSELDGVPLGMEDGLKLGSNDGLKDGIKESTLLVEVLGFEVAGVEFGVNERGATGNIGRGTKTKQQQ
jgi:hypothetical protein